jgi:type VI secretion system secreted protein VgrG
MGNYTHTTRLLSLTTTLGKDMLLVDGFTGREAISSLSEFELDLLSSPDTPVSPPALIGTRVTLGIAYNIGGDQRYFNGIVRSLALVAGDTEFLVYKAEVVPSLWLLTLNTQTRVFQSKTVIEIAKAVLTTYSITPKDDTQATYKPLDYCTQYRETDYDFLARLFEQHGIFFYFTHTDSDHTMVLGDNSAQLAPCAVQSSFRYMPETNKRAGFYDMYIQSFSTRSSLVTGKHTLWEYRYSQLARQPTSSGSSVSKAATGGNGHEFYDYGDGPSAWAKTDTADGDIQTVETMLQDVARDRSDAQSTMIEGASNASLLAPGATFTLSAHPDSAQNTKFLVLSVNHSARQQPPFRQDSAGVGESYRNRFTAQPAALTYRPPCITPRPRVQGVVTGQVVTPSGEDSYLDKYGRVCVQFWWDRSRAANTTDNTLLRVAQPWAGSGWGTFFWPRVGDEVLIDFLDGDPDAPIVVGSLYNGKNMPKYDPATSYTRSGVLTRSSKNGAKANANELRFEDLKGSEQVYLHAEKDHDIQVENDTHIQIGNERHVTVTKKQFETLKDEMHRTVTNDQIEQIGGDHHLAISGAQAISISGKKGESISGDSALAVSGASHINVSQACNEKIGMNYSLQVGQNSFNKTGMLHVIDAGQEVHIKGGMQTVVEGGMGVCLSGPGGFITIGPSGIMIQGITVMINSGGAALPGSPGMPESPQAPDSPKSPTAATWVESNAG